MDRPVLLDLFCGAGGAARGYHDAGLPPHPKHRRPTSTKNRISALADGHNLSVTGDIGIHVGPPCMGIDWMTGDELSQAIPPAYTRFIGEQLLAHLVVSHG